MRTLVCLLVIIHYSLFSAYSQSANVQSAGNYVKSKEYAKAKEYIDLAAANEATANDFKMWYYRGMTYLNIYRDTLELGKSNPDAVEIAAISFINSIKADKGKIYTDDSYRQVWLCGVGLYKRAAAAIQAADYERATRFYNLIYEIFPYDKDNNLKRSNVTSESVDKGLYFVALKSGDKEKARTILQKLVDNKFNDPLIYSSLSRIYLEQKDTIKALEIVELGLNRFEDNSNLINQQINLYIGLHRTSELVEKLSKSIDAAPENEVLYDVRGTLYQGKKDYDKAAEDYKKAIEIKPDYLDAYYRLGAMYFNQGAEMAKQAAEAANADHSKKGDEEFNKAKEKFDLKFKEAQPYLEKAMEINLNKTEDEQITYRNTMASLKQIYARTNQTEKYNQLKEQAEKK